jgi:hypothetical protein
MADTDRERWNRDMRLSIGCGCGDPNQSGLNHRYDWEGGCVPYSPPPPPRKPVGFRCQPCRWKFTRYRVADHGFRLRRNRYRGDPGLPSAWIGIAVTIGAWSYGMTWGKPDVVFDGRALRGDTNG